MVWLIASVALLFASPSNDLERARDRQDRAALGKMVQELALRAEGSPKDADAQYRAALAGSYLAEVAIEQRDRNEARSRAEAAIAAARRAVELKPKVAEYHRVLGTLCGQAIPGNVLQAMKYGKCAQESVEKAVQLDPKSALALVSRGVGNYYLPAAFGGGIEKAIRDFESAVKLDPKSHEAYLWLGVALRRANRAAEARKAFEQSLKLNPNRVWTRQQLEKTAAE